MLRRSNPNEGYLIDQFDYLGPRRRRMLENGWPAVFRQYLYEELPVDEIAPRFHATMGRPSKEVHTALGCLVLQQVFDLTDAEVERQLAFNTEWHYALKIFTEDDESKCVCERSLREYRSLVTELGIDEILFRLLTDKLLEVLKVATGKQRLDSTHIHSNMRRLSRLGVFVKTIQKFIQVMERDHPVVLRRRVDGELLGRYLDEEKGCFSQVKPSEAKKRLEEVAEDLWVLVETFRDHAVIGKMDEYALLVRVLEEQCKVDGNPGDQKVHLKPPEDVPCTSLQNPSDPDATYDGHKGQGYQVQLMETYQEADGEERDETQPNLITHVSVQQAHESDGPAALSAIEDTKDRGCAPEELLADTAYGSDDNVQKAAQEGTELIAPAAGKSPSEGGGWGLEDFIIDEESDEVIACPVGESPDEVKRSANGTVRSYFDEDRCEACAHRDFCCVGRDEEKHELKYTTKQARLARRRAAEKSEVFREKYRWRAGIEATNSHLKRDLNMKRLRVRGMANVRYVVTLKVLGWNIRQAARAMKARILAGFHYLSAGMAWIFKAIDMRLHGVRVPEVLSAPISQLNPIRR